jgi:hypothetical protein
MHKISGNKWMLHLCTGCSPFDMGSGFQDATMVSGNGRLVKSWPDQGLHISHIAIFGGRQRTLYIGKLAALNLAPHILGISLRRLFARQEEMACWYQVRTCTWLRANRLYPLQRARVIWLCHHSACAKDGGKNHGLTVRGLLTKSNRNSVHPSPVPIWRVCKFSQANRRGKASYSTVQWTRTSTRDLSPWDGRAPQGHTAVTDVVEWKTSECTWIRQEGTDLHTIT